MKAGEIFGTGTWTSGGFGVDLGNTYYESGSTSHNGIKVFEKHENKLLKDLLNKKEWVQKVPESEYEILDLYDKKEVTRENLLKFIKNL